jgi:hypothetical protein
VSDRPTDAVHGAKVTLGIFFRNIFKTAQPFETGKTKLVDKRVGHSCSLTFKDGSDPV